MKRLLFLVFLPVCSFAAPPHPGQFQLSINKPDVAFSHTIETTVHSHHCVGGMDAFNNQFFSGTNGPSGTITVASNTPGCDAPAFIINVWDNSRGKQIGQVVYNDAEGRGPCDASSVVRLDSSYELNLQKANCDSNKPEFTVMVDGPNSGK